jgi:glycosyltransferase involved in cell wall biosynthesis
MISVVMASYLGTYPGSASNREVKFCRAVESFLDQNAGELIVVSDGCDKTNDIVTSTWKSPIIKLVRLPKQPLFAGSVRQIGIQHATHDWICYLDTDDQFGSGHLDAIISSFNSNVDWLYWDDYVGSERRDVAVQLCRIGTSCIAHKSNTTAMWPSGYNHDWGFIQQLGSNYKKIDGARYIVNHIPGKLDQ